MESIDGHVMRLGVDVIDWTLVDYYLCILCRWLFLFEVLNVRCALMWHGFFLSFVLLCCCHRC